MSSSGDGTHSRCARTSAVLRALQCTAPTQPSTASCSSWTRAARLKEWGQRQAPSRALPPLLGGVGGAAAAGAVHPSSCTWLRRGTQTRPGLRPFLLPTRFSHWYLQHSRRLLQDSQRNESTIKGSQRLRAGRDPQRQPRSCSPQSSAELGKTAS